MSYKARISLAGLCLAAAGCGIDTFLPIDVLAPAGVISGSVTYAGPPPCTAGGRIVGAAVLLAFDERLLPPPEGLGTSAAGLSLVPADQLFQGIFAQLPFAPDGSLVCPNAGTPPVTVSTSFNIAPLTPGTFQVRGFYDFDGNFDAAFSIFNLPTKGDIGGGAIENTADVLLGAGPRYRSIALGDLQADGSRVIPDSGAVVEGVAVTLGLSLPLDRPVFRYAGVTDVAFGNTDPTHVVIPSDYQLNLFSFGNAGETEKSFVRLHLGAGVPAEEKDSAAGNPFFFPTANPRIVLSRTDANFDGVRDGLDVIPEGVVPALAPQGIFNKLADASTGYTAQASPSIILQGVTLYQPNGAVPALLSTLATTPDLLVPVTDVLVALRPAVLCLDVAHPEKGGTLLNTHPTDKQGNVLVTDEPALEATLSKQFGRSVKIKYGCMPQGDYALNLIYDTGQVWSVPNEAGICMPGEVSTGGGTSCGPDELTPARARLASQATVLHIGPPGDEAYCAANATPPECLK